MPVYSVQVPSGTVYDIEAPEGTTDAQLFGYVQDVLEPPKRPSGILGLSPPSQAQKAPFTTAVKRGFAQTGVLLGDVLPAMGASLIGADEYAKRQMEEAEATQERIAATLAPQIRSYEEISSVGDAAIYAIETFGEQVPNLLGLFTGVGVAGAVAKTVAQKAAKKAILEKLKKKAIGLPEAEKLVAEAGKKALDKTLMPATFLGSYALNAPEIFQNIYERTGEFAPVTAMLSGGVAAALDSVLPLHVIKAFRRNPILKQEIVKKLLEKTGANPSILKSLSAGVAKGATIEGFTEGAQETISIAAERFIEENWEALTSEEFKRVIESSIRGAVVGAPLGGVGGVSTGIRAKNVETQRKELEKDDIKIAEIRQKLTTEEDPVKLMDLNTELDWLFKYRGVSHGRRPTLDIEKELNVPDVERKTEAETFNGTTVGEVLDFIGAGTTVRAVRQTLEIQGVTRDLVLDSKYAGPGGGTIRSAVKRILEPALRKTGVTNRLKKRLDALFSYNSAFLNTDKKPDDKKTAAAVDPAAAVPPAITVTTTGLPDAADAAAVDPAVPVEVGVDVDTTTAQQLSRLDKITGFDPTDTSLFPSSELRQQVEEVLSERSLQFFEEIEARIQEGIDPRTFFVEARKKLTKKEDLAAFEVAEKAIKKLWPRARAAVAPVVTKPAVDKPDAAKAAAEAKAKADADAADEAGDPGVDPELINPEFIALSNAHIEAKKAKSAAAAAVNAHIYGRPELVEARRAEQEKINQGKATTDTVLAGLMADEKSKLNSMNEAKDARDEWLDQTAAEAKAKAKAAKPAVDKAAVGTFDALNEGDTARIFIQPGAAVSERELNVQEVEINRIKTLENGIRVFLGKDIATGETVAFDSTDRTLLNPTDAEAESARKALIKKWTEAARRELDADKAADEVDAALKQKGFAKIIPSVIDLENIQKLEGVDLEKLAEKANKSGSNTYKAIEAETNQETALSFLAADIHVAEGLEAIEAAGLGAKDIDGGYFGVQRGEHKAYPSQAIFNRRVKEVKDAKTAFIKQLGKDAPPEYIARYDAVIRDMEKQRKNSEFLERSGYGGPTKTWGRYYWNGLSKKAKETVLARVRRLERIAAKPIKTVTRTEQDLLKKIATTTADIRKLKATQSDPPSKKQLNKIRKKEEELAALEKKQTETDAEIKEYESFISGIRPQIISLTEINKEIAELVYSPPDIDFTGSEELTTDLTTEEVNAAREERLEQGLPVEEVRERGEGIGEPTLVSGEEAIQNKEKIAALNKVKKEIYAQIDEIKIAQKLTKKEAKEVDTYIKDITTERATPSESLISEEKTLEQNVNEVLNTYANATQQYKIESELYRVGRGDAEQKKKAELAYTEAEKAETETFNFIEANFKEEFDRNTQIKELEEKLGNTRREIEAKRDLFLKKEVGSETEEGKAILQKVKELQAETVKLRETITELKEIPSSELFIDSWRRATEDIPAFLKGPIDYGRFTGIDPSKKEDRTDTPKLASIPSKPPVTPTTVERTKAILDERMELDVSDTVSITTTPEEAGLTDIEDTASAVIINGKPYLFTNNIQEGNELGVFMHEVGVHMGMRHFVGSGNYNWIIKKIKQFAKLENDSPEAQLARTALNRVKKAKKFTPNISEEILNHELIAYFVEEAVYRGINPSQESRQKTALGIWFKRLIAGLKRALNKLPFIEFKDFDATAQDIVDFAYGAAHLALRTPADRITPLSTEVMYSLASNATAVKESVFGTVDDIIKKAPHWSPQWIAERMGAISKWKWRNTFYNGLGLVQLADTVRYYSPNLADLIDDVDAIVGRRRKSMDDIRMVFRDDLITAKKLMEVVRIRMDNKPRYEKDVKDFYTLTHRSSIEEIDLREDSTNLLAEIDAKLTELNEKIKLGPLTKEQTETKAELERSRPQVVKLHAKFDALPLEFQQVYKLLADRYEYAGEQLIRFNETVMGRGLTDAEKIKLGYTLKGGRIVPYFPLVRGGEFWVDAEIDGKIHIFADKNQLAVMSRIRDIEKPKSEGGLGGKTVSKIYGRPSQARVKESDTRALEEAIKILSKELPTDTPETTATKLNILDQINHLVLQHAPSHSLKQQFKRREGVEGFENDVLQNFAMMGLKYSNEIATLDESRELQSALGAVENFMAAPAGQEDKYRHSFPEIAAMKSMKKRAKFLLNPVPHPIAAKLSYFGYAMFLLGNISSAIVNLTQLPIVTFGLLSGDYGFKDAGSEITAATKLYFSGGKDNNTKLRIGDAWGMKGWELSDVTMFTENMFAESRNRGNLEDLYEQALQRATIRRTTNQELQDFTPSFGDPLTGQWAKAQYALSWFFQNSERANREISLMAAYNLAMKSGLKHQQAVDKAIRLVDRANGPALAEAGPAWFTDGLGKVIGTFKRFAFSQIYLQTTLARKAFAPLREDPNLPPGVPTAKQLAQRELASIMIPAWTFAGMQGMPLWGLAPIFGSIYTSILGDDDDDKYIDFDQYVRKSVGDLAYRGPLSHFLGVDFAGRTGFHDLLYRNNPYKRAQLGAFWYAIDSAAGPVVAAGPLNWMRSYDLWEQGRSYEAFEASMPAALRNPLRASRWAIYGVENKKGMQIMKDVSAYNLLMQGAGFTPNELAKIYQKNEFQSRLKRKIQDRRSRLLNLYFLAQENGDRKEQRKLIREMDEFSDLKIVRGMGLKITATTRRKSRESRLRHIRNSVSGLSLPPKYRKELNARLGYNPYE